MGIGTAGSIEEKIQTRQTDRQATRQTHKIMALRQDEHQSKSSIKKWYAVEHSFFKKIKKVSKQTTLKLHLRFFFFVTVYQLFHRILKCIYKIFNFSYFELYSLSVYIHVRQKKPHNWEYYIFRNGGVLSLDQCNFLVLHEKWFSEYWIFKTCLKYILTWLFSWIFNSCIYFLFCLIKYSSQFSGVSYQFLFYLVEKLNDQLAYFYHLAYIWNGMLS